MKPLRHLLFTLLCALLPGMPATAAEPPGSLFGVELGSRFRFPACDRGEDALTSRHCHNAGQITKTAWGTEEYRVFYPRPQVVPWARGELLVETAGGLIVAIHVNTWGIQSQGSALEALTKKYGPPARQRSEKITGQRSRFPAQFAEWELKDLWVRFDGTTTTIDWGRITLATPDYRRRTQQPPPK